MRELELWGMAPAAGEAAAATPVAERLLAGAPDDVVDAPAEPGALTVATPDPLKIMQVATTRVPEDTRDREPFLPDERLTLEESLDAYTMGSAYANHREHDTGSIEVGKRADLAVLDRNVFAHPTREIADARCLATYVDGDRVYAAADD